MTEPREPGLDPAPELVVQLAAIQEQDAYVSAYHRIRRWVIVLTLALVVLAFASGYAVEQSASARARAHTDTQLQIQQLACGVVDQIPPDHGAADSLRVKYACGPYKPPKAVVQPKPGVSLGP